MSIIDQLAGGSRRDQGAAKQVATQLCDQPRGIVELLDGMQLPDPIVCQRCAHAIRYIAQMQPELLLPYRHRLFDEMARLEQWEVREQFCMAIVCLPLTEAEQEMALARFNHYLETDHHSIVRTCALQGMVDLVPMDGNLMEPVKALISHYAEAGTAAMRARCRKLLKVLGKMEKAGGLRPPTPKS